MHNPTPTPLPREHTYIVVRGLAATVPHLLLRRLLLRALLQEQVKKLVPAIRNGL